MTEHNGWDSVDERRAAEAFAAAGLVEHDHFFVEREGYAAGDVRFFVAATAQLLRQERADVRNALACSLEDMAAEPWRDGGSAATLRQVATWVREEASR